jgi:hypothetical protein
MAEYVHGAVRKLAESLAAEGVSEKTAAKILEDGESIGKDVKPERKAEWMAGAMHRMDQLLDAPVAHAARERCACCLGGKRHQLARAIAKEHDSLEERVRAANETPFVFGHSVSLTEEGAVRVRFSPEGQPHYGCVCLRKAAGPVSVTYCYCCGGHVKHHLQNALGRKLEITVERSALASGGKEPCTFLARIVG